MRKTQVTVYLDAAQMRELDARAARARLSRSAYVSRLVEADLAHTADAMRAQLARTEEELLFLAQGMRTLLETRHPDLVGEVHARMDERLGPGAAAELMEELDRGWGHQRRVRPGADEGAGPDRGQAVDQPVEPPPENGGQTDRGGQGRA